jgi:hypothetical protein
MADEEEGLHFSGHYHHAVVGHSFDGHIGSPMHGGSLGGGHGGSLGAAGGHGGSLGGTANSLTITAATLPHRNSPYVRTPTARTPGGTISHPTEHGAFLDEKLEYIVPPSLSPIEHETPANARTVFMGHMRFETTAAEVRWIVRKLTGVTPLKAEPRGKGCFLLHLNSESDEAAVRGLHHRILMDHHGVWVARNAQEQQVLADYVEFVLTRNRNLKRLHLPKDCVCVETPHQTHFSRYPGSSSPPHSLSPHSSPVGVMGADHHPHPHQYLHQHHQQQLQPPSYATLHGSQGVLSAFGRNSRPPPPTFDATLHTSSPPPYTSVHRSPAGPPARSAF